MAQQNLLVANEHLFARKGEAAPANGTVTGFGQGCFTPVHHSGTNKKVPLKPKHGKRNPSPLASLIQRGTCLPDVASDAGNRVATEHTVLASWRELRTRLETACQSESDEQWKKLTFRVRYDQYIRLKNLAGLWGSSYQNILEKAVAYYIDEATTSEDFQWKV